MTDLEATRLCAEAMGWKHLGAVGIPYVRGEMPEGSYWCMSGANDFWIDPEGFRICAPCQGIPDPLHDDAQAMALVYWLISNGHHIAFETATKGTSRIGVCDNIVDAITDAASVRRFIVSCVAAMQQAKEPV